MVVAGLIIVVVARDSGPIDASALDCVMGVVSVEESAWCLLVRVTSV